MRKEYFFATASGCTVSDIGKKSTENIKVLHLTECGERYVSFGRCDKTGLEAICSQWDYEKFPKFWFVDKNRFFYSITKDGTCEKTTRIKRTRRIYSSLVGNAVREMKGLAENPKVLRRDLKRHPSAKPGDVFIPYGLPFLYPMFKRFSYYFSEKLPFYRFALHIPRNNGKKIPLVISLHGANLRTGHFDNYLHMADLDPLTKFRLFKKKCYVLMPRTPYCVPYHRKEFDEILWTIIEGIDEKYGNIDRKRIYLFGASWGGHGTLVELIRHPERYAAAVGFASWYYIKDLQEFKRCPEDPLIRNLDDDLVQRITQTPLWLMCSTGDKGSITFNDKIYEMLIGKGTELKYTRASNGGHVSSINKFRMQKDWVEWLFLKSK